MLITDVQVHLWEPERHDRPWPPLVRPPHRPHGFSAEEMLREMASAGVDRAIIVPPAWAGDDNSWALAQAAKYPGRFAVIGRLDVRASNARGQLAGWLAQPGMLGIRMSFHIQPFVDWLDDGSLDWFWRDCERHAIPVMALVPGIAGKLLPVVARHPGLRILIAHMGCGLEERGAEAFVHIDSVLALARYPNVAVNLSAVPVHSGEPFPFQDIALFIRRIYDAFGPRRMLWGADLSRMPGSYRDSVRHIQEALPFLSAEDKEWLLGKTLAEVLRWPENAHRRQP